MAPSTRAGQPRHPDREPIGVWCSVSTQSAPEGIRTPNLLIRSQMLYPLSYGCVVPTTRAGRRVTLAPRSAPRNRSPAAAPASARSPGIRRRAVTAASDDPDLRLVLKFLQETDKTVVAFLAAAGGCEPSHRPSLLMPANGAPGDSVRLGVITSFVHHVDTCDPATAAQDPTVSDHRHDVVPGRGAARERDGPELTTHRRDTGSPHDPRAAWPPGSTEVAAADAAARHPLDHRLPRRSGPS